MQRKCACGKLIAGKRHLCNECSKIYGPRSEWPEWLRFWVNDTERELRLEDRIDKHEVALADIDLLDECSDFPLDEDDISEVIFN